MDNRLGHRKKRKDQGVRRDLRAMELCRKEKNWQPLSAREAKYLGVPGLDGYWYCYCDERHETGA
jgi:hypothetical protein